MNILTNLINDLSKEVSGLIDSPLLVVFMLLFLSVISYTDIKTKKIKDIHNLIAFIFLLGYFLYTDPSNIHLKFAGAIAGASMVLIPAMIMNKPMGGDIKAIFVISFCSGAVLIVPILTIACITGAILIFVSRLLKKGMPMIPFAPFFGMGYVSLVIMSYFIK